jgi:hypothetical protein
MGEMRNMYRILVGKPKGHVDVERMLSEWIFGKRCVDVGLVDRAPNMKGGEFL